MTEIKRLSKILRPTTVIAHSELGEMVHTLETTKREWCKKIDEKILIHQYVR